MVVTRWGARFRGRRFACAIGRGGIRADKAEGDGAAPAGIWRIVQAGYRADRMASFQHSASRGFKMQRIGLRDIWSDDPDDPDYNHWVQARAHPFRHECLRRSDPLYDLVLMSDWNWPDAVTGRGSAIFVHHWRKPRHPTEGCIAFSRGDLRWILARWEAASRIFVRA